MKRMKRILLASSVICFGVLIVSQMFLVGSSADETKIWKNEEAYIKFLKDGNPEGMMSFWHGDGVGWPMATPQPFGNKEARKAYLENLLAQMTVVSFELQPKALKIFGDVAVVHYFVVWISRDSEGTEEELKTRITHTWMRQAGQWRIIGGMSSG